MTVIARPNHPFRLAGYFAASVAGFALVAAAAGAILYIVDNERGGSVASGPTANVELPDGLVLVQRIDDPSEWRDALGFSPILPEKLPEGTDETPVYMLQQPDARGRQAGHVRFTSEGGPTVVLVEMEGQIAREAALHSEEMGQSLAFFETFTCGTVVMQTQLYFSIDGANPPTLAAMNAAAEDFSASLHRQCED